MNNKDAVKRVIIWFIILMLLGNIGCLFESVIIGNIVRTVLVVIAYIVFNKTRLYTQGGACSDGASSVTGNVKLGLKLAIPVFVIMASSFIVEFVTAKAGGSLHVTSSGNATINGGGAAYIVLEYALLSLAAAVCEELTFRGVPMEGLVFGNSAGRDVVLKVVILSSAIFGLFHLVDLIGFGNSTATATTYGAVRISLAVAQSISAFGFGIAYAAIYCRSRSIIPAIALHFINNAMAYSVGECTNNAGQLIFTVLSALMSAAICGIYGISLVRTSEGGHNSYE